MTPGPPRVSRRQAIGLWLSLQGLAAARGKVPLDRRSFLGHLEATGGLQLDSIQVLDRAHYLTLWSRFGTFDRSRVDRWVYRDRVAYEYWGHEASILPHSHLALGRRRMLGYPPKAVRSSSYWSRYRTSPASKRRVLTRLKKEGPLESSDFQGQQPESKLGGMAAPPREDKRSLRLLWHAGRIAVADRKHFRRVYALAEDVYPSGPAATTEEYEDSWLSIGLGANGVASERHLEGYWTGPAPKAAKRKAILARNLRRGKILEVSLEGSEEPFYALPEHLDRLGNEPTPRGTTLLCPFDSLLWQRRRAEELFDFHYRVEIYVPAKQRKYGYYVLPILHGARLVGRLDPKLHRDRNELEIRAIHLEPDFRGGRSFERGLSGSVNDLANFLGAGRIRLPPSWKHL